METATAAGGTAAAAAGPPAVVPAITPPLAAPAAVPEWLKSASADEQKSFGQYATMQDMLKAHNELRTKLGGAKPADDSLSIDPAAAPPTAEDLHQFIESAGLHSADVSTEWQANGKLTDAQYKSLAGKGLGRKAVDSFLAMETELRTYKVREMRTEASKIVGGEEQLTALIQWGKQPGHLKPDELTWYNDQVANPASAVRAVEWLASRQRAATGASGVQPHIEGGAPAGGGTAYTSRRELIADRSHPDYREGTPHFARVQARLRATPDIVSLR